MTNQAATNAMPTPKAVPWSPDAPAVPQLAHPAPQTHAPAPMHQQPAPQMQAQQQPTYAPQMQQAPQVQHPQIYQNNQPTTVPAATPQYTPTHSAPNQVQPAQAPQAYANAPQSGLPPMPVPQHAPHMAAQPAYPAQIMPTAQAQQTAVELAPEKAKISLLSRFQKPKTEAVTNAVEAVKKPAAESLINPSFLKGLAAGVILTFAGSTLLGKLGGTADTPARIAKAPVTAPVAAMPTSVEGTAFVDEVVGAATP